MSEIVHVPMNPRKKNPLSPPDHNSGICSLPFFTKVNKLIKTRHPLNLAGRQRVELEFMLSLCMGSEYPTVEGRDSEMSQLTDDGLMRVILG